MAPSLDDQAEAVDSRSFDTLGDAAAAIAEKMDGTLTDETGAAVDEDFDDELNDDLSDGEAEEESPKDEGDPEDGDPDDDGDDDEDDEPETAIDAPASMTAEEKQAFAQLPKEAQQLTRQFAARRETEIHQGLEKSKSAQQAVRQQAVQSIAEAKQAAAQDFMTLANAYAPQAPDPALAQHNPSQYIAEKAQYDAA